jgi:hypothetical protein
MRNLPINIIASCTWAVGCRPVAVREIASFYLLVVDLHGSNPIGSRPIEYPMFYWVYSLTRSD